MNAIKNIDCLVIAITKWLFTSKRFTSTFIIRIRRRKKEEDIWHL